MDTMSAYALAVANSNKPHKVFDWHKAARLIRASPEGHVEAGLERDWENTGGPIWQGGKVVSPEDTYTFLASNWAVPMIEIDGTRQECWVLEEGSGWDAQTYWPDSALAILKGED